MKDKGFTLLELIIALCIVAIIATFAVPAYRQHVAKAHRLDAAAASMRAVQYIECTRLAQSATDAVTLSAGMDQAPSSGAPVYRLAVLPESATNGGYSIEATPVAYGPMQDDSCGVFIVDATGVRSNRTTGSAATALDTAQSTACWGGKN
ncbi:type IV pilin protein [Caballeronia sp. GAWG1-1]|uniref:type IV pilin protein n=1 Tax=Caballeronia sp. GAWG1-1 TaxID=2921742 RepID=UPI0020282FC7|nr:type IV pilin protein [Caballeronia sp. GAWG1-1]